MDSPFIPLSLIKLDVEASPSSDVDWCPSINNILWPLL